MVCGLVQLPVVTVLSAVEAGLEPSGYLHGALSVCDHRVASNTVTLRSEPLIIVIIIISSSSSSSSSSHAYELCQQSLL